MGGAGITARRGARAVYLKCVQGFAALSPLWRHTQEDILKVIVDLPEAAAKRSPRRRTQAGGTSPSPLKATATASGPADACACLTPEADTGLWRLIMDGGTQLRQPQYFATGLELQGKAVQLPSTAHGRCARTPTVGFGGGGGGAGRTWDDGALRNRMAV